MSIVSKNLSTPMKYFFLKKNTGISPANKWLAPWLYVLIVFSMISLEAKAQPANDNPCNATLLNVAPTCSYQVYTTTAATSSPGVPAPGCANYTGGDVWFKIVVPCSGSVVIDTDDGVITDGGMAIYRGTCSSLIFIECDDDDSQNGAMPRISRTGLTPGDTIWIRVWEYGNNNPGTFGICVTELPPPGPGGSCSTAAPFCTSNVYTFPNTTNVPSLGGGGIYGCLFSTPNPVFYYMQIQNPGNLNINIVQTSVTGTSLDVDFACWGPFTNLAASCGGLTAANNISCSYSTSNDETAVINGALTGQFYVLLLTNYSNQPGSITFQVSGGNASTNCAVICNITAANTGPVCPGQSFNLTSSLPGASYIWTGPNCFSSNQQNPTGVIAPSFPGSYTYTVTATTPSGNSCTASTTVVVGGLAGGTATPQPTTCPGVIDGTITVTPNLPDTYIYTLNPGNIVQNNNPVFTGLAPNTYTVTFANPIGCTGTVGNIIVANGASPTASVVPVNTTCPGLTDGTITITPPATGAPFVYTLTPGNIVQNNNPVFQNLAPNNYSIAFTTAIGCSGTIPNINIVNGAPVAAQAITAPTSCPTVNDGTITITPPATGSPFIFTLNPGNIVQNNNPVFSGLASGTYTISFTTALGCSGVVSPNPVVAQGGPLVPIAPTVTNPPCANINDGIIIINPPVPGNYTYVLNPGLPTAITQVNNPNFTGLAPGTYTYSFTNTLGCIGTGNVTLTTNTPLTTTVTLTKPLCNGNANGNIRLNPSGGVTPYEYTIDNGVNWQPANTFPNLPAGTYSFTIRDNAGCTKDTTVTLTEPTVLDASATSQPGTCNGNDGRITVSGSGGTAPYRYSIDDGVTYQNSPVFIVSGGFYPNIKVIDNKGCIADTVMNVVLIDNMVITPMPDSSVCVGQSIVLKPNVSTQANIFKWRTIPDSALVSTLDNSNIKNPTATTTDTTTYIVNARWGVCFREDTINVNILHKPVANAGNNMAVCNYKRDTLLVGTATNVSGPVNYQWSPAGTLQTPDQATTIAIPDSTQLYTLTVTDDYGCGFLVTDEVIVTVQPPVPAYAGKDTIAVLGVPHQLMSSGGVSYEWSPAFPLNLSTLQNPLATLTKDQFFVVTVTDSEGCLGNDSVFIKVYNGPTYYVPSSFTPNGDGLNDIFRAIPVGISYTEYFRVYNRYGQMVFQTNRWLQGWNGSYLGKSQDPGTYIWMVKGLDKNGRVVEQRGTVLIIK
jgi:gliding motility-associated-like protein